MKPVQPEELSALLDNELSAARAREVEAQLLSDATLSAEFDALVTADRAWRAVAASAVFVPRIQLPEGRRGWPARAGVVVLVTALIALRIAPKLADSVAFGVILHGVAVVALIAITLWLATRSSAARPPVLAHGVKSS